MAMEVMNGSMGQNMLVIGKLIKLVAMERNIIQMGMFMKGIGRKTKRMVLESIEKQMVLFIRVNGKIIYLMVKE